MTVAPAPTNSAALSAAPDALQLASQATKQLQSHFSPRRFAAGHVLWTGGDDASRVILLKTSRVEIVRVTPGGASTLLFVFGPGDLSGDLPFFDGGSYSTTLQRLQALEPDRASQAHLRPTLRSPRL